MVVKERSLDINSGWIVYELSIEDSIVEILPMFMLSGEMEPDWLRMATDRTWIILVRKSDKLLMMMEVNMDGIAYKLAIGAANGRFEKEVSLVGDYSRDFDPKENLFSYLSTEGSF